MNSQQMRVIERAKNAHFGFVPHDDEVQVCKELARTGHLGEVNSLVTQEKVVTNYTITAKGVDAFYRGRA